MRELRLVRLRNLSRVTETGSGTVDHHESESSDSGPDSALLLALCGSRKKTKKKKQTPVKGKDRDATNGNQDRSVLKVLFASKQQSLVIKIYYFIVLNNTNDRARLLNAFHHRLIHLILLADKYCYYLQFSR